MTTSPAGILIVVETDGERLPPIAHELAGAGRRLADAMQHPLHAAVLGPNAAALARELALRGVARVHALAMDGLSEQPVEARVAALAALCAEAMPRAILIPHTPTGTELAPRLAFRLDGAVATGCSDVGFEDGEVLYTRPCWGGVAREVVGYAVAPAVATVRAGAFEAAAAVEGPAGEVVPREVDLTGQLRTRVAGRELEAAEGVRLEDARVIVAGGRGLEGPDGFGVLQGLAAELGGAVGASRVPCDLGWCPHSWQIGLTGKTVTPELYIAVGISGAGHHMAGCGNSRTIVAINTDPEAAILQDARYGVIGDYREIVPALTEAVRRVRAPRA